MVVCGPAVARESCGSKIFCPHAFVSVGWTCGELTDSLGKTTSFWEALIQSFNFSQPPFLKNRHSSVSSHGILRIYWDIFLNFFEKSKIIGGIMGLLLFLEGVGI